MSTTVELTITNDVQLVFKFSPSVVQKKANGLGKLARGFRVITYTLFEQGLN